MKSLVCIVLLIASAVLFLALTPIVDGPLGKMDPCTNPSRNYTYFPPTMKLIPEGEYEMGDHLGTGVKDELPVHAAYIDAFYMDTFEVTNKEYCTYLNSAINQGLIEVLVDVVYKKNDSEPYCDTTGSTSFSRITWNGSTFGITTGKEDHPMVQVSWYGAVAYANWRSAREGLTPCYNLDTWECTFGTGGYRLPTEAEWEKAARGGEHSPYHDYPWGNINDGSNSNYWDSGDPFETGKFPWTSPMGYYDGNQIPSGVDMANGYGLYDVAGNVWEWCNDWYEETYYQYCVDNGIYYNPIGPSSGSYRVLRGGSWVGVEDDLRCANRNYITFPSGRYYDIGFRLAFHSDHSVGMAYILGGDYEMGDHHDGMWDALPVHAVYINDFHIDIYEVTNKKYCTYLNSAYGQGFIEVLNGVVYKKGDTEQYCNTYSYNQDSRIHWNGSVFSITAGKEDHPMVTVSWYGAVAYANWRSDQDWLTSCYNLDTWECAFGAGGYRLPTEAEWEKAARGGEHNPYYRYPWGDVIDGSKANYFGSGDPYETGPYPAETTPVGYYNSNGYGLFDMAGNVWEWCNDWSSDTYYSSSPYNNPKGPAFGAVRVLRGGSWYSTVAWRDLRCAYRFSGLPHIRYFHIGFRLVLD